MTEVEEKTEFKFSELSDKAKAKAREAHTGEGYLDYDWWDFVFEDAVRMAAILGITISTSTQQGRMGNKWTSADIYFSGFSSQGDGASFRGNYEVAPEASAKIREEAPTAETLHRIADQLSLLQLTRRLTGAEPWKAAIPQSSGNYIQCIVLDADDLDPHESVDEGAESAILQLMRDFADWIYKQLNDEYDWLHSDECVDESLTEELFDEFGAVL